MRRRIWTLLVFMILFNVVFTEAAEKKPRVEINIPSRTLSFYRGDVLVKQYPVCVGKVSTPTPVGEFKVIYKAVNPYWIHDGETVPPGPQNPLGIRWMGLAEGIGIHGNNKPESIGTLASGGCIRMYNKDVAELYAQIPVGTSVSVKYNYVEVFEDLYNKEKVAVVYPDFYKINKKYEKVLFQELESKGLGKERIDRVKSLIKSGINVPTAVTDRVGIFLNDRLITCDAFSEKGEVYVSYQAAKELFGLSPEFMTGYQIAAIEKNGAVYINLSGSAKALGWNMHFNEKNASAYIKLKPVKVNGIFLAKDMGSYDSQSLIDVKSLKALGYEYMEDAVDITLFEKQYVKVQRDKKSCISLDPLISAIGGEKITNSLLDSIELTVPVRLKKDGKYYKTIRIEHGIFVSREIAETLKPEAGENEEAEVEASKTQEEYIALENFLEGLHYRTNEFSTVIEIFDEEESDVASN